MGFLKNASNVRVFFLCAAIVMLSITTIFGTSNSVGATDLPVVNKSGTLSSNETWTAGFVYMVGGVTVPGGVTLTIDAGVIIKANGSYAISVASGGTLNVAGTNSTGVLFTSPSDDSAGGDSNGDGPSSGKQGNYDFITSYYGGLVDVQRTTFQYGRGSLVVSCQNTTNGELNISDSTIKSQLYLNNCRSGYAQVSRNHFEVATGYPVYLNQTDASIIQLTGINQNTFTGTGQASTVYLGNGTFVGSGNEWEVSVAEGLTSLFMAGPLDISGDVILDPGTVIKVQDGYASNAFRIEAGASIIADGTSASPIIVTSISDDSIGGDSNGDGPTARSANAYNIVFDRQNGSVSASHMVIRSARNALSAYCIDTTGNVSFNDNQTEGAVNLGGCHGLQISVKRNSFAVIAQYPLNIGNSDVDMVPLGGDDENTFAGSAQARAPYFTNSSLNNGQEWVVANDTGISALVTYGFGIGNNSTVSLDPGAVVKVVGAYGFTVEHGSRLEAIGTGTNSITLTSLSDDSIAGDSGGDGATTGSSNNYWSAVRNEDGMVNFSHVVVRYGLNSISDFGTNPSSPRDPISIEDSTIYSALLLSNRDTSRLTLKRNHFSVAGTQPLQLSYSDPSSVILSGDDKNTFNGTGIEKALYVYQPTIATGNTWTVESTSGVGTLLLDQMTVNGEFEISPGVNIKPSGWITVGNGGVLSAAGTVSSPITFTSRNDDSAGGDTNGDGSSSASIDNYTTDIRVLDGGTATLDNVALRYAGVALYNAGSMHITNASIEHVGTGFDITGGGSTRSATYADSTTINTASTGLYVGNYSDVTYHGSITNVSNTGVHACNWLESCAVDVTYTDWGTADGPFPSTGNLVCGQTIVTPWIHGNSTQIGQPFNINNCGISLSPSQQIQLKSQAFRLKVDGKVADCSYGIQDACDVASVMKNCVENAVISLSTTRYPILKFAAPMSYSPSESPELYSGSFIDTATIYFNAVDKDSVASNALDTANTASVLWDIATAYSSCTP